MARVRYLAPPELGRMIGYQKYYLLGLEQVTSLRMEGLPLAARLAPGALNKIRAVYRLARGSGEQHVGRYVFEDGDRSVRFAIDGHDRREIRDPGALDWSDVYFKANLWPQDAQPAKVLPVVNGNGLLDLRKLERLRRLRETPKEVDVAFVSNVWGGREHNLRLFEELARLPCSKDLLAVFPEGVPSQEDEANMARLRKQGIPITRDPVPPAELWRRLARARVVPLRAGKHLCVSWRMIDLLAMGACIVYDALPPPRWPQPFEAGREVASCGIERPDDTGPAADGEYAKVAATIEPLLARPDEQERLRRAAARYFDDVASPRRVAEYLLGRLAGVAQESSE